MIYVDDYYYETISLSDLILYLHNVYSSYVIKTAKNPYTQKRENLNLKC